MHTRASFSSQPAALNNHQPRKTNAGTLCANSQKQVKVGAHKRLADCTQRPMLANKRILTPQVALRKPQDHIRGWASVTTRLIDARADESGRQQTSLTKLCLPRGAHGRLADAAPDGSQEHCKQTNPLFLVTAKAAATEAGQEDPSLLIRS